MAEKNSRLDTPVSLYYYPKKMRLQHAIDRDKTLLAENQFNTTADKEARRRKLESKKEELRKLEGEEIMASNRIWGAFDTLWPEVHQIPTTTSPRGG